MYLTDLADAARSSGLRVVELDGWKTRGRPTSTGPFNPKGILCHHTGSHISAADRAKAKAYALWLAVTGRSDLPPPLCQLSLGADGTVYVCAAGRANHAGEDKASGGDGNRLRLGIEAQNSGTEGWGQKGTDASGQEVTQGQAYARLCAALNRWYKWPASNTKAHRETSVTGKWDPGGLDMTSFRAEVARLMTAPKPDKEDDVALTQKEIEAIAAAMWEHKLRGKDGKMVPARVLLSRADDEQTEAGS